MKDKELLDLAAKAAEIELYETTFDGGEWERCRVLWNPLTNDGDALRLAVRLSFCVSQWVLHEPPDVMVGYITPDGDGHNWIEDHRGDSYAATRRAIVRAAAEIGKGMK